MGKIDKKEVDKKDGEKTLQSPEQICDHLRVTEATLTPHPHLKPGMSAIIAWGKVE